MAEEVVIRVREERSGDALSQEEQRINALKARIQEINRLQAEYAQKGITGTSDLTQERTALQRELSGIERDQAATAKQRNADERSAAKDRVQAEREITREQREREAVSRERWRAAGTLATAGIAFGGVMADDYFQRQGIGLRDEAARRAFDRDRALHAVRGYSAEQAVGDLHAMEDELFNRQNRRAELLNQRTSGAVTGGLAGLAGGAAAGAALGSIVPGIGTVLGGIGGALIAGGAAAYHGYLSGDRALTENDKDAVRLQEEIAKQEKIRADYFQNQISPQLEGRKAMLNYDMQSYRVAMDRISAEKEFQRVKDLTNGDVEAATAAAQDKVALEQRERAGNWAGIINARSGTRDSLRAATFATTAGTYDGGDAAVAWLKKIHEKQPEPPRERWDPR